MTVPQEQVPGADFIPWTPARVRVTAGLMIAMFVAALDATIVGTALPTIGRELGDFALFPLVFSGYLLTSTTTVSLWGRLADLYGRKPVLLVGLALFVGSSMLCGLAGDMLSLVLFRALQGVGPAVSYRSRSPSSATSSPSGSARGWRGSSPPCGR